MFLSLDSVSVFRLKHTQLGPIDSWYINKKKTGRWIMSNSIIVLCDIISKFQIYQCICSIYLWGWKYISTILNLGTKCKWIVSFKHWPLYSQERPPISTEGDTMCTPETVWRLWSRNRLYSISWNQTPSFQPITLVVQIELFRLHFYFPSNN